MAFTDESEFDKVTSTISVHLALAVRDCGNRLSREIRVRIPSELHSSLAQLAEPLYFSLQTSAEQFAVDIRVSGIGRRVIHPDPTLHLSTQHPCFAG